MLPLLLLLYYILVTHLEPVKLSLPLVRHLSMNLLPQHGRVFHILPSRGQPQRRQTTSLLFLQHHATSSLAL